MPASTSLPSTADLSHYSNGAKPKPLRVTVAFSLSRLHYWVTDQIIQYIPEDIAVCEFDCRKPQCTFGEWEACKNRRARPEDPSTT